MLIVLMQPQHSARASQILPCVLDHFLALVAATNAKEILLKDCSLEGAKTYFWLVYGSMFKKELRKLANSNAQF